MNYLNQLLILVDQTWLRAAVKSGCCIISKYIILKCYIWLNNYYLYIKSLFFHCKKKNRLRNDTSMHVISRIFPFSWDKAWPAESKVIRGQLCYWLNYVHNHKFLHLGWSVSLVHAGIAWTCLALVSCKIITFKCINTSIHQVCN